MLGIRSKFNVAVVALVAALAVATVFGQGPPSGPPVTPVVAVAVERRPVPVILALVGSVQPNTRSLIASELAGVVEEITVKEGDRVAQGAVLCRLRDTTHKLAVEQARAQLAQLKAQLDEWEAGSRTEELERARAEMDEAKALYEKWSRELERVENLRGQGSASPKEYNDTLADTAAARQRLAQTKANYELAVAGPRKEQLARGRFAVDGQEATLARLEYDLAQTVIRAPFAGYVTDKRTEIGEWITVGGPVVELIDLDTVLVKVDVPESAINACKEGQQISVVVDALEQTFRGRIKHVYPQADERARTFPIEIELTNQEQLLKSGMFVRARVPAGPIEESLVVPRDAVLRRQSVDWVVAVVPSLFGGGLAGTPVPVELGANVDGWIAVRSPTLQAGMQVAIKGHDRIYGPEAVQVIPGGSGPTSAPAETRPEKPAEGSLTGR